ncbi:Fe-S cluster assembly scaffold protein NifU, partial [Dysosmobacter welbionis]
GHQISHEVLLHRQLEQQVSHPFAQGPQLAIQYVGQYSGQILIGPLRVQVAGVELNRLFDILIFCGAVVFLVVGFHLIPHSIVHPDGVPVSIFTHCQIPPKSVIASAHVPQRRGYSSVSLETASIVVWAFRKSVSPCSRKPPALRAV